MQRGGGGRDGFFGFGGPFPGFGSFVQPGSLISSFFGGANPVDDPFFTNPFGAMMGPSLLQQSMFGRHRHLSGAVNSAGGFLQQAPEPSRPRGPIIKELSSDDEDDADVNKEEEKKKGNPRKHPRMSKEPYVEDPDEEAQDDKRPKLEQFGREYARASTSRPQPQTFMFQSSTITYGGPIRACYSSSTTRRTGGDITVEESKEADTTTGKATHRISRGIGNKGHSFTRKLNCDGNVNTMQTLHNLNGDELAGFEESWQRNARQNLPRWDPRVNMLVSGTVRSDVQGENQMLPLPAPDQSRGANFSRMKMHTQNGSNSSRMKLHSQNGSLAAIPAARELLCSIGRITMHGMGNLHGLYKKKMMYLESTSAVQQTYVTFQNSGAQLAFKSRALNIRNVSSLGTLSASPLSLWLRFILYSFWPFSVF